MSARHRGQAFGLEVLSEHEILGLGRSCSGTAGRETVCRLVEAAELERVWPRANIVPLVDLRHPDGRLFMSVHRHADHGYRIFAPRHGRHVVSLDGREIRSALPTSATRRWQRLFFAQALPLAAALQGLEVLHASAVVINGRALAFAAASGTGKTSVAAHLVAAGATFLTDDVLALSIDGRTALAHPGPAYAGVPPDEVAAMSALGKERLGRHIGTTDKAHFSPDPAPGPLPLGILYRLRRDAVDRPTVRELPRPEPHFVLGSCFLSYLSTRERLLNQLDTFVLISSSVRVLELTMPRTGSAQEAAELVLGDAPGAATGRPGFTPPPAWIN